MRDKRSDNIPTTPLVTQHTHTGHHRGPAVATRESSHVGPRGREDVWIRRATDLGCTLTSDGPLLLGTSWGAAPRPRRGRDPDPRRRQTTSANTVRAASRGGSFSSFLGAF